MPGVQSLRELSMIQNAQMLLDTCWSVQQVWGSYSHPVCTSKVDKLQTYLVGHLGRLVNDVCEKAHELLITSQLEDVRILFAVEVQKYLKSFIFQNEVMFRNVNIDAAFWETQLGKLTNVTVLDIRALNCTDGMINAICDNCHQLQVFRFKTHFVRDWPLDSHGLVTTAGVKRLLDLKKLCVIEDTCNFVSFSNVFLKKFFHRLLPRLENFTHENIKSFLLDNLNGIESLPLKQLTLHEVRPPYLLAMIRLCPKLKEIHFTDSLYGGVFDDLADCSLNIASLRFNWFSADFFPGLSHFLLYKGDALTSLALRTDAIISVNEVILIGECCPNLQTLELKLYIRRGRHNPYSSSSVALTDKPLFRCLTSLYLGDFFLSYIDYRIVELFLKYDSGISVLSLDGKWITMFEVARKRMPPERKMFPNLTKLTVCVKVFQYDACSLIKFLYNECSKLKFLHLYSNSDRFNRLSNVTRVLRNSLPLYVVDADIEVDNDNDDDDDDDDNDNVNIEDDDDDDDDDSLFDEDMVPRNIRFMNTWRYRTSSIIPNN